MIETETVSPTNWRLRLIDARNWWSRWAGDKIFWTSGCQQCPLHFKWEYTGGGEADTCEWGVVHKNLVYPLFETRKSFRACGNKRNESPRVDEARRLVAGEKIESNGQPKQPMFPEFMKVTESEGDIFTLVL